MSVESFSRDLIIDRPDLVPPGQKLTAMGITLLFWAALLYLWQPLLSLIAWGLNLQLFYNHMILLDGYRIFLRLLSFYLVVIVCLGGGLILWARINQWRFRGKERRVLHHTATDMAQLTGVFGISEPMRDQALAQRIVTVHFGQGGEIDRLAATPPVENGDSPS